MSKNIQTILDTEMSRRDFLKTVGFGMISIFGFATIIKALASMSSPTQKQPPIGRVKSGFGTNNYGNKNKSIS